MIICGIRETFVEDIQRINRGELVIYALARITMYFIIVTTMKMLGRASIQFYASVN